MAFKRGKGKINTDYGLKDLYKFYKRQSDNPVTYNEFREIVRLSTSYIMHEILYNKNEFNIPFRLGSLRIKRFKNKIKLDNEGNLQNNYLKVDFKKSLDLWRDTYPGLTDEEIAKIPNKQYVYHLNRHSDGKYHRFYWDKISSNVKNHSAYSFTPIRKWKQELSRLSKQHEIYSE